MDSSGTKIDWYGGISFESSRNSFIYFCKVICLSLAVLKRILYFHPSFELPERIINYILG